MINEKSNLKSKVYYLLYFEQIIHPKYDKIVVTKLCFVGIQPQFQDTVEPFHFND